MDQTNQKRVAFLIPSLAVGGAELQLIRQLELLEEGGFTISLIVLGDELVLMSRIKLPEERRLFLREPHQNHLNVKGIFYGPVSAYAVFRFLRKNSTTKLVAILPMGHWVGRWTVFIGRIFLNDIRLANYHKSQQFKANPPDTFGKKLFHRFGSILSWYTDRANLFISQSVLNDISRNQFVRRPVIVYNFVLEVEPDESLATRYLRQHGLAYKRLIVIPGRVHPVKGQLFFLEATQTLLTPERLQNEGILILLVGGGPDEQAIQEKCAERGIEKYVHVTGFVKQSVLLAMVKLADLVIIPSLFEGLGNVAIEALMLRRPVIASDAGGLTEIVKDAHCGFTFKAGDSESLQDIMHRYLNNELHFDTQAGYTWYRAHFTAQIHIDRLQRFIEKL